MVTKRDQSFIISGDTYINPTLWEEINNNKNIKSLIIECSFPDKLENLAKLTKHLTPSLLAKEFQNLKRKIPQNSQMIFMN